jgi:SAM-dependent methyltransferase
VQDFQDFDTPSATEFVKVRQDFSKALLEELRSKLHISSAADVGCGVGYFSKFLRDLGFGVTAIDGREENVQESKRRYPDINFLRANAEDLPAEQLGTFDLVFCFGLLYHLENPFRAIRSLHSITGQVLFVESMCAPGDKPRMELLDEYRTINQGLDFVAFYATESCLVKMLYRAGFRFVYGFNKLPEHDEFRATRQTARRRTMLVASKNQLSFPRLTLMTEPERPWDIWANPSSSQFAGLAKLVRGLRPRIRGLMKTHATNKSTPGEAA